MTSERQAVLFDLDDTIYPFHRFVLSGLSAVARQLEADHGLPAARTFRVLVTAMRGQARGRELQAGLEQLGLAPTRLAELIALVRCHPPRLRLPREAGRVLRTLRPTWRLGIVTNGTPDIQKRKIAALGLADHVDAVIYAEEHGSGRGKPDVEPFHAATTALGVAPARAVFVGDSEQCDVAGAGRAGLHTLLLRRRARPVTDGGSAADAVVRTLGDVPHVAKWLVCRRESAHGE